MCIHIYILYIYTSGQLGGWLDGWPGSQKDQAEPFELAEPADLAVPAEPTELTEPAKPAKPAERARAALVFI